MLKLYTVLRFIGIHYAEVYRLIKFTFKTIMQLVVIVNDTTF